MLICFFSFRIRKNSNCYANLKLQINYDEFLDIWGRRSTGELLRDIFKRLDADKSGNLSKEEIINGIQSDEELKLCAPKLANMLVTWCQGASKNLKYDEFIRAYENARG